MHYQQIKQELAAAGRLVDEGNVAEADKKIHAMLGKGLTGADLKANLSPSQIQKLRAHARGK